MCLLYCIIFIIVVFYCNTANNRIIARANYTPTLRVGISNKIFESVTLIQIIDYRGGDDCYVNINFYIIFITYRCKLLLILMVRGKNPYHGKPEGSAITAPHCHCYYLNGSGSIRHTLQTQKKHRISHVPCFDDVPYPPISIIIMVGSPIDVESTGTRM